LKINLEVFQIVCKFALTITNNKTMKTPNTNTSQRESAQHTEGVWMVEKPNPNYPDQKTFSIYSGPEVKPNWIAEGITNAADANLIALAPALLAALDIVLSSNLLGDMTLAHPHFVAAKNVLAKAKGGQNA
jgi:hypothetical protein